MMSASIATVVSESARMLSAVSSQKMDFVLRADRPHPASLRVVVSLDKGLSRQPDVLRIPLRQAIPTCNSLMRALLWRPGSLIPNLATQETTVLIISLVLRSRQMGVTFSA